MARKQKLGISSNAKTTNPKDAFGNKKVSITRIPAVALAHEAIAMMDGAEKYGPFNWRDKKVLCSIYVDAALRHLLSWFEGQEFTPEFTHHLGNVRACCAILLDAQETGNLVDDRPIGGDPDTLDRVFIRLRDLIQKRRDLQSKKRKR